MSDDMPSHDDDSPPHGLRPATGYSFHAQSPPRVRTGNTGKHSAMREPEPEHEVLAVDPTPGPTILHIQQNNRTTPTPDSTLHEVAQRSPGAWVTVQIVYRLASCTGAYLIYRLASDRLVDGIAALVAIVTLIGGVEAVTAWRGGKRVGPVLASTLALFACLIPVGLTVGVPLAVCWIFAPVSGAAVAIVQRLTGAA